MVNSDLYFMFYSDCIIVKGLNSSLIYDLNRSSFYPIENQFVDMLIYSNGKKYDKILNTYGCEVTKVLDTLIENEVAFLTSTPSHFPEIDMTFSSPSQIVNAVIEVDDVNNYDIISVIDQLDKLGCRDVTIIFNENHSINDFNLSSTINRFNKSYISNVEIIIPHHFLYFCENVLVKESSRIGHILFYKCEKAKPSNIYRDTIFSYSNKCSYDLDENIDKEKFQTNLTTFSESLIFNIGLNRSISIDKAGNFKNFLSHQKVFGNVKQNSIKEVINSTEFQYLWQIRNDDIEFCKLCKYRYCCVTKAEIINNNGKYQKKIKCEIYKD